MGIHPCRTISFNCRWRRDRSWHNNVSIDPGTIATLSKFNWKSGDEIEGRIVSVESTKPFRKIDGEKDFKVAGLSGIVCTIDGEPIYRKNFYKTSSSAEDTLIAHDNGDEISAAYAEEKVEDNSFEL